MFFNAEGSRVLEFTCIVCPMGCRLRAILEDGEVRSVEGNKCPRGIVYAQNEVEPKRIIITVIKVSGGNLPVVSVKTSEPIPKEMIPKAMRILSKVIAQAPVKIGQIIIKDFLGLKVNVIATRNVNPVQTN
jgi:CxxC motif-containing protein